MAVGCAGEAVCAAGDMTAATGGADTGMGDAAGDVYWLLTPPTSSSSVMYEPEALDSRLAASSAFPCSNGVVLDLRS